MFKVIKLDNGSPAPTSSVLLLASKGDFEVVLYKQYSRSYRVDFYCNDILVQKNLRSDFTSAKRLAIELINKEYFIVLAGETLEEAIVQHLEESGHGFLSLRDAQSYGEGENEAYTIQDASGKVYYDSNKN